MREKFKTPAIKANLFVHPTLELLIVNKTTLLSKRSFDWAVGSLFIPPTSEEPTGRLLVRFRLFNDEMSQAIMICDTLEVFTWL